MKKSQNIPALIFKYSKIDEFLLHHLITNEFWFSSLNDFNDPFDCNICFDKHLNRYFDKEEISYRTPTLTDSYWTDLGNSLELGHFNTIDTERFKIVRRPSNDELLLKISKLKVLVSSFGICCFSATKSNTLMWSHYANSHKGICIGYDTSMLSKSFPRINWITYSKDLPSLEYDNSAKLISTFVTHKSKDWEYEKEIRIISEVKGLHSFSRGSIKKIIFGLKTPVSQIKSVISLLSQLGYKDIEIMNVVIINNEYKIQFSKIEY